MPTRIVFALCFASLAGCSGSTAPDTRDRDASLPPGDSGSPPGDAGPPPSDTGPAAECPTSRPEDGAPCDAADLSCQYLECETTGESFASCDGATWSVTSSPCMTRPCSSSGGEDVCEPGEICVISISGSVGPGVCVPNPCAPRAASCDCVCNCTTAGSWTSNPPYTFVCDSCPAPPCV